MCFFLFLEDDFFSELKVIVGGDFLNICVMNVLGISYVVMLFYYYLNLRKFNFVWNVLFFRYLRYGSYVFFLCSFYFFFNVFRCFLCIIIDFFFMFACGNGFDELLNWIFYLNGKGVCYFFCK